MRTPGNLLPFLHLRRALLALCLLLVVSPGLPASFLGLPPGPQDLQRFEFALVRMGTQFRIVVYAPSRDEASRAAMAAFERVEQLEDIMSDYREESELVRLSREAVAAPKVVSPELFFVLERAAHFSRLSGGAFDVTIGPVVQLWREARRTKRLPAPVELAQARAAVDYRNVELDPAARTVHLRRSGMRLDLGAIAKGYAADEALKVLQSRGYRSALVDAGGDIALGGAPPGAPGWKIAIDMAGPKGEDLPCTLVLHGLGIATSGDRFQFVEVEGERYSHIVNPQDGLGLKDSFSTTVIAGDAITADVLATTLSVMPVTEALKLVESLAGASAYLARQAEGKWQHVASQRFPQGCAESRRTQ